MLAAGPRRPGRARLGVSAAPASLAGYVIPRAGPRAGPGPGPGRSPQADSESAGESPRLHGRLHQPAKGAQSETPSSVFIFKASDDALRGLNLNLHKDTRHSTRLG